jgi:hypothetical protein
MASKTKATRIKRIRRDKRRGVERKSRLRRKGTTPPAAVLFGDAQEA